jgi:hypothetical protein
VLPLSSCLSAACLSVPFPHGSYARSRRHPSFPSQSPLNTYLPQFMLGVLLAQERFSALDSNCYGVPRPIEVRHARHLPIQDLGVLVRRRPSIAMEELVAPGIDISAASTRQRIDLLFPTKLRRATSLQPSTSIFRKNRRRRKRSVHGPTSAPPPDGVLYSAPSLRTPALARRYGNNQYRD